MAYIEQIDTPDVISREFMNQTLENLRDLAARARTATPGAVLVGSPDHHYDSLPLPQGALIRGSAAQPHAYPTPTDRDYVLVMSASIPEWRELDEWRHDIRFAAYMDNLPSGHGWLGDGVEALHISTRPPAAFTLDTKRR